MQISAIQKLTLLDFPGKAAATVFTPGCNFRCGYCHNSEFVLPEKIAKLKDSFIPEEVFFKFLEKRKNLLDGICITGGEPTLQHDLEDFIKKIRALGFLVKLDTNGSNPAMVKNLLAQNLLDYTAMDVKASPENYQKLVGVDVIEKIRETRDAIMNSGINYEFRTTLVKELVDDAEWKKILQFIQGAKKYFLQNFQTRGGCLDPQFQNYHSFSKEELETMRSEALEFVAQCEIRN
jgi:pyruvate formate lyase activating enzyme